MLAVFLHWGAEGMTACLLACLQLMNDSPLPGTEIIDCTDPKVIAIDHCRHPTSQLARLDTCSSLVHSIELQSRPSRQVLWSSVACDVSRESSRLRNLPLHAIQVASVHIRLHRRSRTCYNHSKSLRRCHQSYQSIKRRWQSFI